MNETDRTLEVFLSQLDKRLVSFEQNLLELRREMGQLREDVATQIRDVRGELGQFREEVATQIRDVRGEIAQLRTELHGEIVGLRTEVKTDIAGLRTELREEIRQVRGEMEAIRAEGRSHLRWSLAGMFTLFGAATPFWMWVLSRIIK